MEGLGVMTFGDAFSGARVLVTGHTGFKGSWLTAWLLKLGAEVTGISLPLSNTQNALFLALGLQSKINHRELSIVDYERLRDEVKATKPQFVFHLAAQSLVRPSYIAPRDTFATNVMGTVNLLEALRTSATAPCHVVVVTSDKCYENWEWVHSYRENDSLGGHDPYSASKGATEIVAHGYRRSFFSTPASPISLATARAGNVIGGGDWAIDRIVPDCIRALTQSKPIGIRNKVATRPWQHVLEPLSGYLWLASALSGAAKLPFGSHHYNSAFNFGPHLEANRTVAELVTELLKHWPGEWRDESDPNAPHEAMLLNLAIDKSHHFLRWQPVWTFEQTIENTALWYRKVTLEYAPPAELLDNQIERFTNDASTAAVAWAT